MKCPMSQIWFALFAAMGHNSLKCKHSTISILTFQKSLCLRDCRAEDSRTWLKDTFIIGKLSNFHRFSKFSSYLHPRVILFLFIRASIVGKPCAFETNLVSETVFKKICNFNWLLSEHFFVFNLGPRLFLNSLERFLSPVEQSVDSVHHIDS